MCGMAGWNYTLYTTIKDTNRQATNHRKKSIEKYTDECPHTYDISTY